MTVAAGIVHYRDMNSTGQPAGKAWWQPPLFERRRRILERRQEMIRRLRQFFSARGYAEVETPALQVSPGLERHLTAFETALASPAGDVRRMYLHTSPEFAMKKLLVAGMDRIWQLARVFRDGERSWKHHPEFSMLEWYRAGAGWRDIAAEAAELVRALAGPALSRDGVECDLSGPWRFLTVAEAFREYAGIELAATIDDPRQPSPGGLSRAAGAVGVRAADGDSWEDVFFRIFLERVEPHLGRDVPVILHSWPVSMAAMARAAPGDPSVAERFEIFACGVELANGYGELTDPAEHRRRFAETAEWRQREGRAAWPADDDLLQAIEAGMPDCAGIAMGFDRLVMLATGAARIEDVLWVPVASP